MNINRLIGSLAIALLALTGCEPESFTYDIQNETGDVKIHLDASRLSPLDGFTVNFTVNALDRPEAKLSKEIFVSNLSDETISVEWQTPYSAEITFLQRDDTQLRFKLTVNENVTHLYEIVEEHDGKLLPLGH